MVESFYAVQDVFLVPAALTKISTSHLSWCGRGSTFGGLCSVYWGIYTPYCG